MEQLAGSQAIPVRIEVVERALAELWRAAGDPGTGDESPPAVTRAAAWNLLVPCEPATEAEVRKAVLEVVGAHPARVLLLVAEPDGPVPEATAQRGMTASVAALCRRAGGARRQVCCELIALRAGGTETRHLADAGRALLVPDLPVAVWWPDGGQASDVSGPLATELAPLADRWIVDTGETAGATGLRATQRLAGRLRGAVSDLAWMRLLPWRELTAQFFDPPAFRRHLERVDRLEVWIADGNGPSAEALLWLGWVAGNQGWRVEGSAGADEWRLRRGGRTALAAVRRPGPPQTAGAPPGTDGSVTGIRPRAGDGQPAGELLAARLSASDPEIAFTVTRGPDEACATQVVTTEGACPLPRVVQLARAPLARLLAAALSEPRRDRLYSEALSIAARLAGQAEPISP
jgi:glucose-6-phosphate dehydrogenase assembly protein OpcA